MEKRLNALLRLAISHHATDIHFTLYQNEMVIEMRINNAIRKVKMQNGDDKLIKYLQYLSNLDIGNIKIPQTGQFEWYIDGKTLSLRFALINTQSLINGVLRILNEDLDINLNNLSYKESDREFFKKMLKKPNGLFLISGPTGSGKTTTLYTLLNSIKNKKIFTIEDPIEIHSNHFIQIGINESINLGYDEAIKQVLRHDPDIIMIGEIRDEITAKMVVRAANTGHLVISTIHAASSIGTIERMLELGVEKGQLINALIGISSQRLFKCKGTDKKMVIYETIESEDIVKYCKYGCLDNSFIPLQKSIDEAYKNNIIEETAYQ